MDVTDEAILSQLKLKRIKLTLELQRINLAIEAFEGVDINSINEFELMAIDPSLHTEMRDNIDDEPKLVMYHEKMSYEEKILWALGKLRTATAKEITDYIIRFDGGQRNRTRLLERITHTASRMCALKKINAVKRSRINIYSLKE